MRFLCAALILLILSGCGNVSFDSLSTSRYKQLLLSARFMSARLAGQDVWSPCRTTDTSGFIPRTSCGEPPSAGSRRFQRIARAAERNRVRLLQDTSFFALHTRGIADLFWQESTALSLEHALENLERASRLAPRDARVLNDLAAAYV
jgi:hypothetical protein